MPGVDPVTAIAEAVKEIAAILALAFSGKNRKILQDVKNVKKMKKALDIAEEIFRMTDTLLKDDKDYKKLRKKFDKND